MHRRKAAHALRQLNGRAQTVNNLFTTSPVISGVPQCSSLPNTEVTSLLSPPLVASSNNTSTTITHDLDAARKPSLGSSDRKVLYSMIFKSPLNALLLLSPLAIMSYTSNWSPTTIFILNFLVMIPLANLLGDATEHLALHTGETIGGLVNATFGNAVEVVIAVFALKNGQIEVVQASMIGSCLSNLLFVLGCCFLAGGFKQKECHFNITSASANSSLLMLSSFAMLLPTYYYYEKTATGGGGTHSSTSTLSEEQLMASILIISRIAGIFLFIMYIQMLCFQLVSHHYLFVNEALENEKENDSGIIPKKEEEEDLSMGASAMLLLGCTLLVAFFSELLVSSIDGFTKESSVSKSFIGIILLPIVGNAVEHVTAVKVAWNGKMELALGVAVGSATQISMFVVPVVVLAGWALGQPMSLAFPIFDVLVYLMSILIVYAIIADGKSNWLEGSMLLTAYALIAVSLLWIKV